MVKRVGIFSGTFDPVHGGHVAFVEQAIYECKLDDVFVIPERKPRHKQDVTLFSHRIEMLKLAFAAIPQAHVVDAKSNNVTFETLNELNIGRNIHILVGSDVLKKINQWKNLQNWLHTVSLVVGIRHGDATSDVGELIARIPVSPRNHILIKTQYSQHSSSGARKFSDLQLPEITSYVKQNGLYSAKPARPLL